MAEKRRGLGRGLGALIPSSPAGERPVDVFFPGAPAARADVDQAVATEDDPGAATGRAATGNGHADFAGPRWVDGDGPHIGPSNGAGRRDGADARSDGSEDDALVPVPGAQFAELPVGAVVPNPRQPRTVFDEDALDELSRSIAEIGVLQPVVVRRANGDGAAPYELIMGERRLRAAQIAGLETIPAIIRDTDDSDLLRDALLENLHRAQLNPLEEAAAYQQLLDDFGCTHDELARRIHRSRPQITNTLRMLKLPPLVQRRVAAGVLSAGHARALLGLAEASAMERLAQRIVAEGLSVRATEEIVALGGDEDAPTPKARRPRAGGRNAALDDLASRLSDRWDTRVKVALGRNKGRLTIEFASVQDLNRILDLVSPDDHGLFED
ncbi:ParB/RepB/Spo0J family partition protein [Isoptericola sp. b441]|uniref:ParB/RepB/Spo0J family partition protein n=1 Tax=Actinotalea lenta TaxID=3064654 RepID=A0ABT9D5U7_9CELL|nr:MULTISPECIES: ParB/RepB/Spo0J family partition protein [unclassified Isoptericola]MDO8106185.1 ParB/RepB/Spo0J family partition protein [Isoptericola sp. b441]MDO8122096.1 ParB/RepB/Spo0J family partition protein [Isoptericola sp. b490]